MCVFFSSKGFGGFQKCSVDFGRSEGPGKSLDALRGSLLAHRGRLEAGSPTALLQRGYALVTVEGRTAYLRDAAAVEVGQALQITLAKGALRARVEQADSEPSEA